MTPSPRGFPAQSNTAQLCEHVADSRIAARDRRGDNMPTARDVDLAILFGKAVPIPAPPKSVVRDRTPTATVDLSLTEKKLFIRTGRRRKLKSGQLGSEELVPVILVTATAFVNDGKRIFFFRVTNRASRVFDSRDRSRKTFADASRELARICQPAHAEAAGTLLAGYMRSVT